MMKKKSNTKVKQVNNSRIYAFLILITMSLSGCCHFWLQDRVKTDADPLYIAVVALHDNAPLGDKNRKNAIEYVEKFKNSYIHRPIMIGHGIVSNTYYGEVIYAEIGNDPKTNTDCLVLICQVFDPEMKRLIRNEKYSGVSVSYMYFSSEASEDGRMYATYITFSEISVTNYPADRDARIAKYGPSELDMIDFIAKEFNAKVWFMRDEI